MDPKQSTIIVVEDEILIRMLAAETLGEAGYCVIEASGADEALTIFETHDGDIQCLFTDIHMPGRLNGLELAHYVCAHWPAVKLIVTSSDANRKQSELPLGGIFMPKPYKQPNLIDQVQTLLAA
jgi:CheY-like chemotaxis protein